MKSIALFVTVCTVLVAVSAAAGDHPLQTESGWFDLEHCAFCKNLLSDPELLHHMTWESHAIGAGMIQVATVEPEYRAPYLAAQKAMEKLGNDLGTGAVDPTTVTMCGSCAAFSQLMMAGAKMEHVPGDAADVTLITAADPGLVKRIHEYCDRNNKEMALMMGQAPAAPGKLKVSD